MQVDMIEDTAGFDALESQWDSLLSTSRQNGPFLRYKWLRAWWDEYGQDSRLHLIVCRDGRELLGVLPLFVADTGTYFRVKAGRFLGDHDVGSTGLTPFAHPDHESEVFRVFHSRLGWKSPGFDILDLRFMDPDHSFFDAVANQPEVRVSNRCDCCPRITLPADWEEYLGSLTKHMRHEVRRSARRVAERGFELEVIAEESELPNAIEDFQRLHEGRLKEKFGEPYEVSEQSRRFSARSMADLFAEGALRLSFARREDERVAGLYQLRHGETLYALESGFADPGRQDTQRALWAFTIRNAIEEGCTCVDLLLGDQRYKHDWGVTDIRALSRVRMYRPTLAGAVRNTRDAVADWLEEKQHSFGQRAMSGPVAQGGAR